jgi:hypothetical protein
MMKVFSKMNTLANMFLILVCIQGNVNAQKFEGKIKYIEQTQNNGQFLKTSYDTVSLWVKDNKIKIFNTLFPDNEVYVLNKKVYYVNTHQEKIKCDISSDSAFKLIEKRNRSLLQTRYKETILSYPCQKFSLKERTNLGTEFYDFWISDKWSVGQSWSYYVMENIGIVLKFSINIQNGNVYSIASEIVPMKLDDKQFELPNYPIVEVDMARLTGAYIHEKEK